ncbi:MAG TPA: hypothetical protein VHL98_10885 [Microvirga sp.]|jgi:hypothetical protein|nr:hypothetical protein [Microvirga sp.]
MLTFKRHIAPNGLPGFRVFAGAACLGTIFNPGRVNDVGPMNGMAWQGVAPDGTRFGATSRPKLAQKLQIHAAAQREAR